MMMNVSLSSSSLHSCVRSRYTLYVTLYYLRYIGEKEPDSREVYNLVLIQVKCAPQLPVLSYGKLFL